MLRRLIGIAPWLVLLGLVALRVTDPAPIETLRLNVFDEFQRYAPAQWSESGVRIIDIDEDTMARHGQWPWPRTLTGQLLDRLGASGVATVAMDIVFAEPDRTSPSQILPLWGVEREMREMAERLPDHDAVFAASLGRTASVVGVPMLDRAATRTPLIRAGLATAGDDPRRFLRPIYVGATPNLPAFERAAAGQGTFSVVPDLDGVIRQVPLFFALADPEGGPARLIPSLAAEALRVAQGAPGFLIRSSGAGGEIAFGVASGINAVRVGELVIPTDRAGRVWLRDTGYVRERVIPAWRVLAGEVGTDDLADRVVFIGTSAPGLRDIRATPLNPAAAGVEVHARIVEQVLRGEFLERPDWMAGAELIWLIAFGIGVLVALPRFGPLLTAGIALAAIVAPFGLSFVALTEAGLLVDPLFPAATVLALYLVQSLIVFRRTNAERQQVRTAFARYLPPAVVERLARHPERLRLEGETRELTILFCDIRNFTGRSEKMEAEALTKFLNEFLTPMSEVILQEAGTIDKFIGDSIMAFWNAPLDVPDHALRGARAARAMVRRLADLNLDWAKTAAEHGQEFEPVRIGVGLSTGLAHVGNMGSRFRFSYSVIGDEVNLASRLEGMTKDYGVPVLIGGGTAQGIAKFEPGDIVPIPIDVARARGKERAVEIFAVLDMPAERAHALAAAQARLLAAIDAGREDEARAALAEAKKLADGQLDKAHSVLTQRLNALAA